MEINRIWAMPNKWTFTIKPIRELIARYIGDGREWIDPFSGRYSPAQCTNDLVEETARFNSDALDFLKGWDDNTWIGGLYDPPYSITQARKYGSKKYASMKYWAACKDELARIIAPTGIAICCGWTSQGLGKNRGFTMLEILLVPHGGSENDTIVTVERKIR
jgi:hypothetical protein